MAHKQSTESDDGLVAEVIDGERVRGFWAGEPQRSCFIVVARVVDKRGVSDGMKDRVRREAAALSALREAYKHPLPVDPERAAKLIPPSERKSPFKWGTLAWYRNELALAQDRIRLLEAERDRLLDEKRERDPVMQYVVDEPSKRASHPRKRESPYAVESQKWILEAAKRLVMPPDADDKELARAIKGAGTKAAMRYLCEWIPRHRLEIENTATRIRDRKAAAVMGRTGHATRRGP